MSNKISLEVVNFKQELKRIEEEVQQLGNLGIHEQIEYATEQLRVVTPVATGLARASWSNSKDLNYKGDASGTISNDVDYIATLNQGSSKQAPKYFIEQVLSKIGIIT